MKHIENWEKISEDGFTNLPAGPQICKILRVEDVADKEYLHIEFDICNGEFKDYYKTLDESSDRTWGGRINRSYKKTALTFFKRFITAVEKSNNGYHWNWDENTLVGKFVVVVFREEEYINANKELKTAVLPFEFRSGPAYREGKIEIPEKKFLTHEEKVRAGYVETPTSSETETVDTLDIPDDDLPF